MLSAYNSVRRPDQRRVRRILVFLAFLPVALVWTPLALWGLRMVNKLVLFDSDNAIFVINVVNASRAAQYLGLSSRLGWCHPGPLNAYLHLPLYLLSGQYPGSLILSGALFNLLCVVAVLVVCLRRLGPRHAVLWSLVLMAALSGFFGLDSAWHFSLPTSPLLPFGAYLVIGAAVAGGSRRWLAPFGCLAAFLSQVHVGLVVVTVLLYASAVGLHFWPLVRSGGDRDRSAFRKSRAWLVGSLSVIAVSWIPPVVEELRWWPGNLSNILKFFASSTDDRIGLETAARVLAYLNWKALASVRMLMGASQETLPAVIPADGASSRTALVILVGGILTLLEVARFQKRRGDRFLGGLTMLVLVALGGGVYSLSRVVPPLYSYNVLWMGWIGVGAALVTLSTVLPALTSFSRSSGRPWQASVTFVVIVAGLSASIESLWSGIDNIAGRFPFTQDRIALLSGGLRRYLDGAKAARPLIRIEQEAWPEGFGVLADLYRMRVPFYCERWYARLFDHAIDVGDPTLGPEILMRREAGVNSKSDTREAALVVRDSDLSIYALPRYRAAGTLDVTELHWKPWGGAARFDEKARQVSSDKLLDAGLVSEALAPGRYRVYGRFDVSVSGPSTGAAHLSLHGRKKLLSIMSSSDDNLEFDEWFDVLAEDTDVRLIFGLGGWSEGRGRIRAVDLKLSRFETIP